MYFAECPLQFFTFWQFYEARLEPAILELSVQVDTPPPPPPQKKLPISGSEQQLWAYDCEDSTW